MNAAAGSSAGRGATAPARRDRLQPQRRPGAAVGERAVGVDELPERDLGRAERERRTVVPAGPLHAVEAEHAEALGERVGADELEGAHRRDVQRARQRRPHRDRAAEEVVVVARPEETAGDRDLERRVVEPRRRGEQALLDRDAVEERLQCRPRLAAGAHAVHLRGAAQRAARPT